MGRKPLEKVSQREYARRLGISNEAVRKAVEAGKISKGWDKKEKKIIVEKANEEWGNIHGGTEIDNGDEAIKRLQSVLPERQPSRKKTDPIDPEADAFQELEQYNNLKVSSDAPFAEALRVEKVAKARQEVIKLRELTGELVNKQQVYKQLFDFGLAVRQAVLAIPDRHIDSILASSSRGEAHIKLTNALHEALQKLSEADEMTFKQNDNEKQKE